MSASWSLSFQIKLLGVIEKQSNLISFQSSNNTEILGIDILPSTTNLIINHQSKQYPIKTLNLEVWTEISLNQFFNHGDFTIYTNVGDISVDQQVVESPPVYTGVKVFLSKHGLPPIYGNIRNLKFHFYPDLSQGNVLL